MTNANYCKDCNTTLILHADGSIACSCDMLDADNNAIPGGWMLTAGELADARAETGCVVHETIQIWIDETEPDCLCIVSRGVNGQDAPRTLAVCETYAEAVSIAARIAQETGLQVIDEVLQ